MRFDEKNKIILEHLLAYARFSINDLARVLNTSKAAIIRRIKFLEEHGYISCYDGIIDWQKMPFIKKVYFLGVNDSFQEFEKVMRTQQPVFAIMKLCGLYNYQVWCFFKSKKQVIEFEKIITNIVHKKLDIKELVMPSAPYFNMKLLLSIPKKQNMKIILKEIDIKILKHISRFHARDSFRQMSMDLNIPYDTVHYHGTRLLQSGYFNALVAQPGEGLKLLKMTNLLVSCNNQSTAIEIYRKLSKVMGISSKAIAKDSKILIIFFSMNDVEYRKKLNEILSLVPKENITDLITTHWDEIVMNNRYPLEYLLKK